MRRNAEFSPRNAGCGPNASAKPMDACLAWVMYTTIDCIQ